MIREAFKVHVDDFGPGIEKVDITDQDGISWRSAKKQLRQWYLDQAKKLRDVTQKDYFPHA